MKDDKRDLCSKVIAEIHLNFTLMSVAEKYVIDQLRCPVIKIKAVMGAVGTIISKSRNFDHSLRKFVQLLSNFDDDEMKRLCTEMMKEG